MYWAKELKMKNIFTYLMLVFLPLLIPLFKDWLAELIKMQHSATSIYTFQLSYFPKWVTIVVLVLNTVAVLSLALMYISKIRSKLILKFMLLSLVVSLVWGIIEGTSYGSIDVDGIKFKSPSTLYRTNSLLWSEFGEGSLEVLDVSSRSRISLKCVLSLKVVKDNSITSFQVPFRYSNLSERTKLVEVLELLKRNNIHVTTKFHYMARSKLRSHRDKAMSVEYINKLRSLTTVQEEEFLPLP